MALRGFKGATMQGYCAAALGSAFRGAAGVRFAAGTSQITRAATTVSELPADSPGLNVPLSFFLFPFSRRR